ncbi:MAG: hypothetical protein HQM09_09865 [Candidatus Riflebacteria bacterium]|nr:hypothetical protein [Candidatus Riflebacteria bacterium]
MMNLLQPLKNIAIPVVFFCLTTLGSAWGQKADGSSGSAAYDRIVIAQEFGTISLRESVILRAKLLYAPSLLKDSEFALQPGEKVFLECLTGFDKDIHRVFPELSNEERRFLASLTPDLQAIIEAREEEERKTGHTHGISSDSGKLRQ